jgi:hypothetical protein
MRQHCTSSYSSFLKFHVVLSILKFPVETVILKSVSKFPVETVILKFETTGGLWPGPWISGPSGPWAD